jgi:hypothetical protein
MNCGATTAFLPKLACFPSPRGQASSTVQPGVRPVGRHTPHAPTGPGAQTRGRRPSDDRVHPAHPGVNRSATRAPYREQCGAHRAACPVRAAPHIRAPAGTSSGGRSRRGAQLPRVSCLHRIRPRHRRTSCCRRKSCCYCRTSCCRKSCCSRTTSRRATNPRATNPGRRARRSGTSHCPRPRPRPAPTSCCRCCSTSRCHHGRRCGGRCHRGRTTCRPGPPPVPRAPCGGCRPR